MTDREAMEQDWKDAVTEFITTPPNDPRVTELWKRVHDIDAKCRAAGVLPALR